MKNKLPLILALVNGIALLAALGALVYTRVLYKRPAITEDTERARLEALKAKAAAKPTTPGYVPFETVKANIGSTGKAHFGTIGFTLEVRDIARKGDVEKVKPLILDRFLGLIGRKQFNELTNVQGRYVLRTQLMDATNQIIRENAQRIHVTPPKAKGGEGGEGGEGHGEGGEKHEGAAHPEENSAAEIIDHADLVTNVLFTEFTIQ